MVDVRLVKIGLATLQVRLLIRCRISVICRRHVCHVCPLPIMAYHGLSSTPGCAVHTIHAPFERSTSKSCATIACPLDQAVALGLYYDVCHSTMHMLHPCARASINAARNRSMPPMCHLSLYSQLQGCCKWYVAPLEAANRSSLNTRDVASPSGQVIVSLVNLGCSAAAFQLFKASGRPTGQLV